MEQPSIDDKTIQLESEAQIGDSAKPQGLCSTGYMGAWRRREQVFATTLNQECLLFEKDDQLYYSIKGVGAVIWELLERPHTQSELVEALVESFEVSEAQCIEEVSQFLSELEAKRLIERAKI